MLTDLKVRQAKARDADYKLGDSGGLCRYIRKQTFTGLRRQCRLMTGADARALARQQFFHSETVNGHATRANSRR